MCVIIAKVRHIQSPSIKTFEQAMQANPHGFSIALKLPGKPWTTFKTMNKGAMIDFVERNGVLDRDSRWIFHARIKTHGSAGLKNCHCWQDKQTKTIFAHNGTFSITADKDRTDSETYYRNVIVPLYQHRGHSAALKAARMIINGHSKIAMVFEKEQKQIALVGNWINRNGIYYSNTSAFADYSFGCTSLQDDEFGNIDYLNRKSQSFGRKYQCTHNTATTTTQSHLQGTRNSTVSKKPTSVAGHVSKSPEPAWGY